MKSGKGYIIASFALQMIVIPVVLTFGLILMSGFPGYLSKMLSNSKYGEDTFKLIYILIALFLPLLAGGIIGFIFSRRYGGKPESAKARYLTPLLPILYALVFTALAVIFSKGNHNSGWWGIYTVKNPFLFLFSVGLALSGLPYLIPIAEICGYSGFLAGILLDERIGKTAIQGQTARNLKIGFAALFAAFMILTVADSREIIQNGVIELQYGKSTIGKELMEFDLVKVAPFKENNGIAKLDGTASLQFTSFDEMPRLDGATAAYPVYSAFVQAVYKGLGDYYQANKNSSEKEMFLAFVSSKEYPLNIVQCSKTSEAYENLINGQTDIIFVAEPSKAQNERIKAKGDAFVLTPIGSEAFVFFTNRRNPVDKLTVRQIQDIYTGKITNWKEVGGEDRNILPYQRPEDSGSQTIMQNKVMKDIPMMKPTKVSFAGGMGEVIRQVASYKNAKNSIGYSFMYYSSSMMKNNQIKYISVDGIKPTPETVRSKKYPFTVPVYAVTLKSNTNKNIPRLVEWILSSEGQSLVEKTGYVPVK